MSFLVTFRCFSQYFISHFRIALLQIMPYLPGSFVWLCICNEIKSVILLCEGTDCTAWWLHIICPHILLETSSIIAQILPPFFSSHAITINQCFNVMLLTSQAAVFAHFTVSRSFITGCDVNLAFFFFFFKYFLFYFAFCRAGVFHHGDKKSCRPWMATFIPKHYLSECFCRLCDFFFLCHMGLGRNSECRSCPLKSSLCGCTLL